MGQISDTYRINETNLQLRRRFLELTERDIRTIAGLVGWARTVAAPMAKEFYDHQFSFAPTRAFFEGIARSKGLPLDRLRTVLEASQAKYYVEIFEAAAGGGYGVAYFEKRLAVGMLHNEINLPLKWYMGSYVRYGDLTHRYLMKTHLLRPGLRHRAERALRVVFNYDMQAIVDAFLFDMYRTVGLRLDAVTVPSENHDLSDAYAEMKETIHGALVSLSRASEGLTHMSRELAGAADRLTSGVQQQAAAIEETSASLQHISSTVDRTADVARDAGNLAVGGGDADGGGSTGISAVAAIQDMTRSSQEIAGIVGLIDDIAFQTNMLALNAAVEAARAGDRGRGFAVVAEEVRSLALRCASAAKQIRGLIDTTVGQVTTGGELVRKVAALVERIRDDAAGQSRAVREVNAAVAQIDGATQTSAAQSEELSATASVLADHARTLHDAASRLDIRDDEGGATAWRHAA